MSIVIAYAHKGVVYMGCDTQTNGGEERSTFLAESQRKIWKTDEGVLIGAVGSVNLASEVYAYPEIFSLGKAKKFTMSHVVNKIVPELFKMATYKDCRDEEEDDDHPSMKASFIISYGGEIYEISNTFAVTLYRHYDAIGSGSPWAYYALSQINPEGDINEQIVKAMKISAKNELSVGAPFFLINSRDLQFELVGEAEKC